jgi:hypothetical protein
MKPAVREIVLKVGGKGARELPTAPKVIKLEISS